MQHGYNIYNHNSGQQNSDELRNDVQMLNNYKDGDENGQMDNGQMDDNQLVNVMKEKEEKESIGATLSERSEEKYSVPTSPILRFSTTTHKHTMSAHMSGEDYGSGISVERESGDYWKKTGHLPSVSLSGEGANDMDHHTDKPSENMLSLTHSHHSTKSLSKTKEYEYSQPTRKHESLEHTTGKRESPTIGKFESSHTTGNHKSSHTTRNHKSSHTTRKQSSSHTTGIHKSSHTTKKQHSSHNTANRKSSHKKRKHNSSLTAKKSKLSAKPKKKNEDVLLSRIESLESKLESKLKALTPEEKKKQKMIKKLEMLEAKLNQKDNKPSELRNSLSESTEGSGSGEDQHELKAVKQKVPIMTDKMSSNKTEESEKDIHQKKYRVPTDESDSHIKYTNDKKSKILKHKEPSLESNMNHLKYLSKDSNIKNESKYVPDQETKLKSSIEGNETVVQSKTKNRHVEKEVKKSVTINAEHNMSKKRIIKKKSSKKIDKSHWYGHKEDIFKEFEKFREMYEGSGFEHHTGDKKENTVVKEISGDEEGSGRLPQTDQRKEKVTKNVKSKHSKRKHTSSTTTTTTTTPTTTTPTTTTSTTSTSTTTSTTPTTSTVTTTTSTRATHIPITTLKPRLLIHPTKHHTPHHTKPLPVELYATTNTPTKAMGQQKTTKVEKKLITTTKMTTKSTKRVTTTKKPSKTTRPHIRTVPTVAVDGANLKNHAKKNPKLVSQKSAVKANGHIKPIPKHKEAIIKDVPHKVIPRKGGEIHKQVPSLNIDVGDEDLRINSVTPVERKPQNVKEKVNILSSTQKPLFSITKVKFNAANVLGFKHPVLTTIKTIQHHPTKPTLKMGASIFVTSVPIHMKNLLIPTLKQPVGLIPSRLLQYKNIYSGNIHVNPDTQSYKKVQPTIKIQTNERNEQKNHQGIARLLNDASRQALINNHGNMIQQPTKPLMFDPANLERGSIHTIGGDESMPENIGEMRLDHSSTVNSGPIISVTPIPHTRTFKSEFKNHHSIGMQRPTGKMSVNIQKDHNKPLMPLHSSPKKPTKLISSLKGDFKSTMNINSTKKKISTPAKPNNQKNKLITHHVVSANKPITHHVVTANKPITHHVVTAKPTVYPIHTTHKAKQKYPLPLAKNKESPIEIVNRILGKHQKIHNKVQPGDGTSNLDDFFATGKKKGLIGIPKHPANNTVKHLTGAPNHPANNTVKHDLFKKKLDRLENFFKKADIKHIPG